MSSDTVTPVHHAGNEGRRRGIKEQAPRWTQAYARRLAFSDLFVLLWTFFVAHVVWANRPSWIGREEPYSQMWVLFSLVLITAWHLSLTAAGTRDARVVGDGQSEYKRVINSTVTLFAFLAFVGYALQIYPPRSYVLVAVPLGLILLVLSRWSWRQWLSVQRQNGAFVSSTLAVGDAAAITHVIGSLNDVSYAGYRINGVCTDHAEGTIDGIPVYGTVDQAVQIALEHGMDAIIVGASTRANPDLVRRIGWQLEGYDIDLMVAPALANIAGPRVHIRPVAGLPLLHVEPPVYEGAQRWAKLVFDWCGSLVLTVLSAPLLITIAIAIKLTSSGPVFFRQKRVARNGHEFSMIKFRTMRHGADLMLSSLDIETDAGNEVLFKIKDDPRVTRVGRFLRRFSLDELPQLFNVLTGQMSLVGPRPPLPSEVATYDKDVHRRLLVRPGMTGLWQISGRSDLSWEESVRLDLYYVENWSLVTDLVILWRTVRAVWSSHGAY